VSTSMTSHSPSLATMSTCCEEVRGITVICNRVGVAQSRKTGRSTPQQGTLRRANWACGCQHMCPTSATAMWACMCNTALGMACTSGVCVVARPMLQHLLQDMQELQICSHLWLVRHVGVQLAVAQCAGHAQAALHVPLLVQSAAQVPDARCLQSIAAIVVRRQHQRRAPGPQQYGAAVTCNECSGELWQDTGRQRGMWLVLMSDQAVSDGELPTTNAI
jgi:hypothetical protein